MQLIEQIEIMDKNQEQKKKKAQKQKKGLKKHKIKTNFIVDDDYLSEQEMNGQQYYLINDQQ